MSASTSDRLLIERCRAGDQDAWQEFVNRYEGRLMAFVEPRVPTTQDAEDIVQETFCGFLASLPNFDDRRDVASYLFAIAAHKLTDLLRARGRRPWDSTSSDASGPPLDQMKGRERSPSTILRSREVHAAEDQALVDALAGYIRKLKAEGAYGRLKCIELLFVRGWRNKDVAKALGISEQDVANHKHQTIVWLRQRVRHHPALAAFENDEQKKDSTR